MSPGGFPTTRHSQVLAARSDDSAERARSYQVLTLAYYRPVYKYTRLHWRKPEDDAREITHDFFVYAFESGTFARYEPDKARFRSFLRLCLDRFIGKRHRSARAEKRGGGLPALSLAFDDLEREIERTVPSEAVDPERFFETEWARYLLSSSVEALRRECSEKKRTQHFAVFERIDLCPDPSARPSYAEVAEALGVSVSDVTNRLSFARRELRRLVIDQLREITASDEELRAEAQAVLGIRV
ncbi:MAG: sigma-70 family RNA polymerase sigma factor [Polyangiaceae bacterium]|nr:sigma-70 family RNA polymerase sigma factor [Polyangiaceae bacterium]